MIFPPDSYPAGGITTKFGISMFLKCDCTQVEINPLAEINKGGVAVCLAKVNFDDNAEFCNKDIHAKRDTS